MAEKPLLHNSSAAYRPRTASASTSCPAVVLRSVASFFRLCRSRATDFYIIGGPLVFGLVLAFLKIEDDTGGKSAGMVASMCWVFLWWITEAVPLAVTALVPLFLFPLLEIESAKTTSKSYINDTVFLILGSFILAASVRYHNLHKRMAIRIVLLFGSDPRLLYFGFCMGSAFISMWVDNAAAAAMLMPMALGVQQKVHAGFHPGSSPPPLDGESPAQEKEDLRTQRSSKRLRTQRSSLAKFAATSPDKEVKAEMDFCRGVVISITWGVSVGGMSTLTGNAVNLILAGLWETDYPNESPINYLQWMLFAVPFAFVQAIILWILVCVWFCPPSAVKPVSASIHSAHMEEELEKLGPMTADQIIIILLFIILVALWITKSLTGDNSGWAGLFDDYPGNGTATVLVAVSLFAIPNPTDPSQRLMNWSQCKDIPWNVILLVGGGFALADGITESGLSDVLSREMSFLESTPYWAITPVITLVTAVATEFTSNSAIASIFVPLAAEMAVSMNRHPLYLMVPAALGSQLSYMLPIATGPNAIAFSTESVRVKDMSGPGIILKITGIIVLSILMPTLGVLVFDTNSTVDS